MRRRRHEQKALARRYNVYVVELDKAVLNECKFVKVNPNHDPAKACLYVGMTGLSPDERFQHHKKGYKANRGRPADGKRACEEASCKRPRRMAGLMVHTSRCFDKSLLSYVHNYVVPTASTESVISPWFIS